MLEQEYFYIHQMHEMGFADGRLRYLIEQEKVTPVFFTHTDRFILGGYINGKFVGYAVAEYSGLLSLTKWMASEVITKGQVSAHYVQLLQKERIKIVTSNYPFNAALPNSLVGDWKKNDLQKLNWDCYPALIYPRDAECLRSKLYQVLKISASVSIDRNESWVNKFSELEPVFELVPITKDFSYDQICIRKSELNALGIGEDKSNSELKSAAPAKEREIDLLILRVLHDNPNYSATQVWAVLKADCCRKERKYDENEILDEVSNTELVWSDREGRPKSLKKKSYFTLFKNLKDSRTTGL